MYKTKDYIRNGVMYLNNMLRPRHKMLSTLMLYSTTKCQSRCKHCSIWQKPVEHLSFRDIKEIMCSKCISQHTVVGLEGGEFLLHPEADIIMEWFKENHPNYTLLSNCLNPLKVIEAVRKFHPAHLYVSLDGNKKTYKSMRGCNGHDKVIEVVKAVRDEIPISLMSCLSPWNSFSDMRYVIEVAKEYDIDVRIGIYGTMDFFDTTAELLSVDFENYAFVGIGNHSTNNLYPVLNHLHVPLKYICCKSEDKLPLIEAAYPNICATTSLDDILHDDDIKGVFVSVSPLSHFPIASKVIKSGKALFIEKPPCQSEDELLQLIGMRKAADFPQVSVGLQKRNAPVIRILKKKLQKCKGRISYNLKYLTGAYPEGDAMLELFVHPLDYVTFLFGKAEVKFAVWIEHHTLMLILEHEKATGVLELSTGYSWNDAKECMMVNTSAGIFEMEQMESLIYKGKQSTLMGVPIEKVYQRKRVDVHLFDRNNFVPTIHNNQIVTQGYFDTIKSFVDAVEKRKSSSEQSLEAIIDTYKLIESIHSIQN